MFDESKAPVKLHLKHVAFPLAGAAPVFIPVPWPASSTDFQQDRRADKVWPIAKTRSSFMLTR